MADPTSHVHQNNAHAYVHTCEQAYLLQTRGRENKQQSTDLGRLVLDAVDHGLVLCESLQVSQVSLVSNKNRKQDVLSRSSRFRKKSASQMSATGVLSAQHGE